MYKKLFIPGPTEVGPEMLKVLATPQVGHRSGEFQELYARLIPKLKKLLKTSGHVYLATSSASGIMEGSIRNLVPERCLHLTCGAFSERWYEIAIANGKQADKLAVEWGKPNLPGALDEALARKKYDAVAVVHNETSTGVMNPLREIASVVKKYPGTLLLVDAVTSMAVVDIPVDEIGIDLIFAGTQKGFGLPSGTTVFAASERASERARSVPARGYYFDILDFEKYHQRNQTPTTPCIPILYGLDHRLDQIFGEEPERWFARRLEMATSCRKWAKKHFALLPEPGYESVSLTAIRNTRKISVADLNKKLGERSMTLSNGYGKLKEETFRIGHMGDLDLKDLDLLLNTIDEILGLK
ncbi:MAG: alanine--glyoxylate aminotransferase family protein [Planctomycetes bacterium]|nr:alanine--glyoxylate aminotransferase family protein [Planctomycetota bacterium]